MFDAIVQSNGWYDATAALQLLYHQQAYVFRSAVDGCTDFAGATSPVVLVGDVAVGVMLPTVAGLASRADFSEVVAADAISLADAGRVTAGVTDLADAGAAPLADAGMAFPTDPAGVVTVGVAPLADAGIVTVGVADLADAGIPFPADPAGTVTVGVADLADAGIPFPAVPAGAVTVGMAFLANTEMVAVCVTDLADAVASLADAGMVTIGVTDLADPGMVFPANLAGVVTAGVAPLANTGMVAICSGIHWDCRTSLQTLIRDPWNPSRGPGVCSLGQSFWMPVRQTPGGL